MISIAATKPESVSPASWALRVRVLEIAQSWLRTPYHTAARVKGVGVDCATLLCEVYEAAGLVPHIELDYYPPDWHLHRSEERYLNKLMEYASPVTEPLPGDIAAFKFGRCVSHGAIVVEWPRIVHSFIKEKGVCLSDGTKGHMAGRLNGFWRANGLFIS